MLNPTNYYANFRLIEVDENSNSAGVMTNDTLDSPYEQSIFDNTEFERGVLHVYW